MGHDDQDCQYIYNRRGDPHQKLIANASPPRSPGRSHSPTGDAVSNSRMYQSPQWFPSDINRLYQPYFQGVLSAYV